MENGATPGDAFVEAIAQRTSELVLAGMEPQGERQEYFTPREAAEYCRTTENAIRSALKKGGALHEHKTTRGERNIVLSREVLDRYMRGDL